MLILSLHLRVLHTAPAGGPLNAEIRLVEGSYLHQMLMTVSEEGKNSTLSSTTF